MYKLLNWLFGWDYIQWWTTAGAGIARVHKDYNNKCWYWRHRGTKLADIINDKNQVIWLTCKPEKYLHKELEK